MDRGGGLVAVERDARLSGWLPERTPFVPAPPSHLLTRFGGPMSLEDYRAASASGELVECNFSRMVPAMMIVTARRRREPAPDIADVAMRMDTERARLRAGWVPRSASSRSAAAAATAQARGAGDGAASGDGDSASRAATVAGQKRKRADGGDAAAPTAPKPKYRRGQARGGGSSGRTRIRMDCPEVPRVAGVNAARRVGAGPIGECSSGTSGGGGGGVAAEDAPDGRRHIRLNTKGVPTRGTLLSAFAPRPPPPPVDAAGAQPQPIRPTLTASFSAADAASAATTLVALPGGGSRAVSAPRTESASVLASASLPAVVLSSAAMAVE